MPIKPNPRARRAVDRLHGIVNLLMNVKGNQVHLEALLDRKGTAALKKKLTSLEALLEDDDEDDDDGRPDDEDRDTRD